MSLVSLHVDNLRSYSIEDLQVRSDEEAKKQKLGAGVESL